MSRIAVVDDDETWGLVMRERLANQGHWVQLYTSGSQLIEQLVIERPDVIVLDHFMPGQSGLQTIRLIRANPIFAAIPVIMMTADNDPDDILAALRAGASDYVTKPFPPDELHARIEGLLAVRNYALTRWTARSQYMH